MDPTDAFLIPAHSSFVKLGQFSYNELQQYGLENDGCSCYMIAVILFFHRLRLVDHLLGNEFCSSGVTRNEGRSLVTQLVRKVLEALPRSQSFSLRNLIAGWQHLRIQPRIQVGSYEDSQEVLFALLNNLLLKVPRAESEQLFTKFQGNLKCRSTRDCQDFEIADSFHGQSDTSAIAHVIGVHSDMNPINLKEKMGEFLTSSFVSRCQAIMCKKRLKDARIHVVAGKYTIIALARSRDDNQSKVMHKVNLSSFYSAEVDRIVQVPVAVISHGGSLRSGHYVLYSQVDGVWYLNNDSKGLVASRSPFDQSSIHGETVNIIVFENKL